jgi:hypothetical protein
MADVFRIPKGVPRDIRRALRLDKPGRFLSTLKALQLSDLLQEREDELAREHARAYRASERARTKATRDKWLRELKEIQGEHGAVRHGLDFMERGAGQEPLPPLASPDVVPVVKAEGFAEEYVVPHESALEWEWGVDYTEEVAGHRHKKGRASDVSFNARVFDPSGAPITELQVREAVDFFASEGELSYKSGGTRVVLECRAVNWADWKGRESSGTEKDLGSFRSIIDAVGDRGLRVGATKPSTMSGK